MATKFTILFRPHTLPPLHLPFKPLCYSTNRTAAAVTTALSFSIQPYGPSLHKGYIPTTALELPTQPSPNDELNESDFTRVFNISALRVPANLCFDLESRLRGHLLNWPRIRNIARVPGDEIDEQLKTLLPVDDNETEKLTALNRRIYGKAEGDGEKMMNSVLYRDKLARSFNSDGYVKFRNLAKLSRPPKKKSGRGDDVDDNNKGSRVVNRSGKNGLALVEVVDDEDDSEDFSGLLGEEFGKKWCGSTRLLLLDEQLADRNVEELPEAVKIVLKHHDGKSKKPVFQLVRCKLTLFYNYWQMNEILEGLLPEGTIIPSGFEAVGHIAHLNLSDEHLPYKSLIAQVILDKNKPKIQTVVNKLDAIHNVYRTMQLEVLAGNNSLVTKVVENGMCFHVDLATVYWSSKLATERQRLLSCFMRSDVLCDVFAGVGPLAISAAKKVKHVYANDLNPHAVEYFERNCVLNKLERKVEVYNMDGRRFIESVFASKGAHSITQVVMNLPKDAAEFLDVFKGIFRRNRVDRETMPRIHVYGFSKAQDPEFDFHERIRVALSEMAFDVEMHKVRLVAPGKWMLCASFILPESVAYSKSGFDF